MILIMKEDRQKAAEADEAAKRDRIDRAEPCSLERCCTKSCSLLHQDRIRGWVAPSCGA